MKYSLNKREVELELEMEEETMYAMSGTFTDNGAELTQDELDQIQEDYAAELEQEHYERCLSAAEAYYEGDR